VNDQHARQPKEKNDAAPKQPDPKANRRSLTDAKTVEKKTPFEVGSGAGRKLKAEIGRRKRNLKAKRKTTSKFEEAKKIFEAN